MNDVLPRLLEDYSEENILNSDETGLFYKCISDKLMEFKFESCQGGKRSKDKVTIKNGSEKPTLFVIDKFKNYRCFRILIFKIFI